MSGVGAFEVVADGATKRERARCLAWLEWGRLEELTTTRSVLTIFEEMRAGMESGQWPEVVG